MDKKELFIHVGMDKTGTTSMQSFLHRNRRRLFSDYGLCYPIAGQWADHSHHKIAFSILNQHHYDIESLGKYFKHIARESKGAKRVLISSECLFKVPEKPGFGVFRDLINKYFSHTKVIIYLRRQDMWVESRHKHSIITGDEISVDKLRQPFYCDYLRWIEPWVDVVGENNVIVRPFEKEQLRGGSVHAEILSSLDIPYFDYSEDPQERLNTSLGATGLAVKSLLNKIDFKGQGSNRSLLSFTPLESLTNNVLCTKERLEIIEKYALQNTSISERFLNGQRHLFIAPLPHIDEVNRAVSTLADLEVEKYVGYLRKTDKRLLRSIQNKISNSFNSENQDAREAAAELAPFFI